MPLLTKQQYTAFYQKVNLVEVRFLRFPGGPSPGTLSPGEGRGNEGMREEVLPHNN
jgi:hypothetical protein